MTSQDSSGFISVFIVWIFFANVTATYSVFLFFPAMIQTDGFEYLKENCPTILIEILEYVARVSEHFVIQHQHGNEA